MNICEFNAHFPDDQSCLDFLVAARLGEPSICPHCDQSGTIRPSSRPKCYECARCYGTFRPTSQTLFHHSRVPIRHWFYAIMLFTGVRGGVSAHFLERQLGISYKAAWRMGDAIRRHLSALNGSEDAPFTSASAAVFIDETLVTNLINDAAKGSSRAVVFGMADANRVIALPVPDRTKRTLIPIIEYYVSKDVLVVSDSYATYQCLAKLGYRHQVVNHSKGLWKNEAGFTTAPIEVVWSSFKRSLRRVHGRIMHKKLPDYLGEFCSRYNRRLEPASCMTDALSKFPNICATGEIRLPHFALEGKSRDADFDLF